MLTGDLVRPRLRRQGKSLSVDLVPINDAYWQRTANDLVGLFANQLGQPRHAWEAVLDHYAGDRIDYSVLRGLAKVLEDAATFSPLATALSPAQVRERLFALGPAFPTADLFQPRTRQDVIRQTAQEWGVSPESLEQALFVDRSAEFLLRDLGPAWTAESLLARYNMELARGVLYWASEMQIDIHDNYKDFWRYLKLFKLMFEVTPLAEGGYQVSLDGPISPFVKSTTRYGRQFAAFLPALFLGTQWKMTAAIRFGGNDEPLVYKLDPTSPLHSHFKHSGLFDSKLEENFAAQFAEKFGDKRGQWQLQREDEVLVIGDNVFIPDFSVIHRKTGRRALVEIVGFWHPEYLRRKVDKIQRAGLANLVLLVYEGVNLTAEKLSGLSGPVLYFPNKPVLKEVMTAVEACAM